MYPFIPQKKRTDILQKSKSKSCIILFFFSFFRQKAGNQRKKKKSIHGAKEKRGGEVSGSSDRAVTAPTAGAADHIKDESVEYGRGKPRRAKRRWHQARDLQSDVEEDPGHSAVQTYRGTGQLRSNTQRVLLRSASWCLCTSAQLLSHGQVALSDRRLRTTFRGGTRLLGSGFESGGTVLLDDLHSGNEHLLFFHFFFFFF